MKTELITIAFPVFERFDYFEKALNSALNQTVETKIIVVDNNSSHGKFKECCNERFIPYFRNEVNLGMFGNWNRCFELADTEFVMILGDDDFLEPNFIEKFHEAYEQNFTIDVWFSDFQSYVHSTGEIRNHKHILPFGLNKGLTIQEYGIKYSLGFPIISSIIRREKFTGFYKEEHGSNDWAWLYENAYSLTFFGEKLKLLNYGSHPNQDSKNSITHLKCIASFVYLYDFLSKVEAIPNNLKKVSVNKSRYFLLYFLLNSPKDFRDEFLNNHNRYSETVKTHVRKNFIYKLFIILPFSFRKNLFRLYHKISWN